MSRTTAVLLLATCAVWTVYGKERLRTESAEPLPPVSAAKAADSSPSPLEAFWQQLCGEEYEPERGPVVHCRLADEESVFLRLADCEGQGGRVDEPVWARLD